MYSKRTIFDLVLPRLIADDEVIAEELAGLGEGGLCLNCKVCTFPNCGFWKRKINDEGSVWQNDRLPADFHHGRVQFEMPVLYAGECGGLCTGAGGTEPPLTVEEMLKIVHAAAGLGITHYRITGGEPLVRKECVELVQKIKQCRAPHPLGSRRMAYAWHRVRGI